MLPTALPGRKGIEVSFRLQKSRLESQICHPNNSGVNHFLVPGVQALDYNV
jgi:hypothetical protein